MIFQTGKSPDETINTPIGEQQKLTIRCEKDCTLGLREATETGGAMEEESRTEVEDNKRSGDEG